MKGRSREKTKEEWDEGEGRRGGRERKNERREEAGEQQRRENEIARKENGRKKCYSKWLIGDNTPINIYHRTWKVTQSSVCVIFSKSCKTFPKPPLFLSTLMEYYLKLKWKGHVRQFIFLLIFAAIFISRLLSIFLISVHTFIYLSLCWILYA